SQSPSCDESYSYYYQSKVRTLHRKERQTSLMSGFSTNNGIVFFQFRTVCPSTGQPVLSRENQSTEVFLRVSSDECRGSSPLARGLGYGLPTLAEYGPFPPPPASPTRAPVLQPEPLRFEWYAASPQER